MATQRKQTLVFGAIILMFSNLIVKVIGMFFKIPLYNLIGDEGMGYYNAAYSIYVSFYMISTAGIPVAISRMIAASNSKNNVKEVKKIFSLAFKVFFVIGVVGTAIMILFSKQLAVAAKMPDAYLAMIAIAPTLFFICLSSAYRGYFQGLQNMVPSAVSQVIEAVGKIGIGLIAGWYFYRVRGEELPVVAAFVILGVTIGVAAATIYAWIAKIMFNSSAEQRSVIENCQEMEVRSTKSLLHELIITSLPIALASSIMGLTNTVDTMVLASRLVESGLPKEIATSYYGAYSTIVISLLNMTPPLIYPFAIAAIPTLSAGIAKGDKKLCIDSMNSAFRMGALISIPCAIGMGTLSRGIINILFGEHSINGGISNHDLTAPALSVVSIAIFCLAVISITNSILQAYRFELFTIISTISGIIVKIIATYLISGIPNAGVMGSAIGTALGYLTIMIINVVLVITKTKFVPSIRKIFLKPLIAGVFCGAAALGVSYVLGDGKLNTLISIAAAVTVYLVVIVLIKGINRADIMMVPGGKRLCRIMDKFGLLEKQSDKQ